MELLAERWPWYVVGPLIGLMVPLLFFVGGKRFGISSSLRHVCAATLPRSAEYFRYDWRRRGTWNLTFVLGILIGGFVAVAVIGHPESMGISSATVADLQALGVEDLTGFVPEDLISWSALASPAGWVALVGGGFLVGFGARYAEGCTSGHSITGLAELQGASLIATLAFFAGGLLATYLILPLVL